MHIKNLCRSLLVCLVVPGLFGCASIGGPIFYSNVITQENTDLFSGPEAMKSAYDRVVEKKTTLGELEGLGFKLQKGTRVGSSKAYGLLHASEPQINVVVHNPEEYAATQKRIAAEKMGLEAYSFAYKNISVKESRIYISKKKTSTKGHDCQYLFIAKDGVVIHKEYNINYIPGEKEKSALFEGLVGPAMGAVGLGRSLF